MTGPAAAPPRAVLVVGEALVDEFPDGARVAGGAPFNQACWLAALGVPTRLITRIGAADAGAARVLDAARRCGLPDGDIQRDPLRPTGRVAVTLGPDGPRYAIDADSAWDHVDAETARTAARRHDPAVVVLGTLALRSPPTRAAVDAVLQAAPRALRFVDLNLRDTPRVQALAEQALALADWVKLNDEELDRLLAWFVGGALPPAAAHDGPARRDALAALAARFGSVRHWIVTCGARGWFTLDGRGRPDQAGSAPPVAHLVDTVGAGDAFSAVVVAGHAAGWEPARSLHAAARLAAAVCGRRGAVPDDDGFIDHWRRGLGLAAPALRRDEPGGTA